MAIARKQVKNVGNVGHKGKEGKEVDLVSTSYCNSTVIRIFIATCSYNYM